MSDNLKEIKATEFVNNVVQDIYAAIKRSGLSCDDDLVCHLLNDGYAAGYSEIESERDELKRKLEIARECLKFYADRNNWKSTDYDSETKDEITLSDLGCKSFNGENNYADYAIPSGGRRAREALEKIK